MAHNKKSYLLASLFLLTFLCYSFYGIKYQPTQLKINKASEQDTIIVQVIDFNTPSPSKKQSVYDTIAHFPKEGEWRKILMVQTIKCDSSTAGDKYPCGEWDYSTKTILHETEGDKGETFEINSFMTPYGKQLDLSNNGWEYVWDVTDYAPLLKGNKRIVHGNNQELHDLKFIFIKGKPSREAIKVENIWPTGYYKYERLALDSLLKERKIPLLKEGKNFRFKSRISGHGHKGPYNCCEWDEKIHTFRFSKDDFLNWTVWKDCGHNPIFPQGGTWQFNRAGWCPGTATDTYNFEVTNYVVNDSLKVDYQIEMFDDNGEKDGKFRMTHQLITYSAPNYKIDASILEIKSPSTALRNRRNTITNDGTPVLKIRNEGTHPINSIVFNYGLLGKPNKSYTWTGNLNYLDEDEIALPPIAYKGLANTVAIYVEIIKVNHKTDEQPLNNSAFSKWKLPKKFPNEVVLKIKTNDAGRGYENSYTLTDNEGNLIKERKEFPENADISDTLRLKPGLYTWVIHDLKQDGMIRHWWKARKDKNQVGRNGKITFEDLKGETLESPAFDFADYNSFSFIVE